jgi:hypothetical protein
MCCSIGTLKRAGDFTQEQGTLKQILNGHLHSPVLRVIFHWTILRIKKGQLTTNQGQVSAEYILGLLKKCGLLLFVYELATRFGLGYISRSYFEIFPIDDLANLNDLNSVIKALTILFCGLVIALIILRELDKSKSLTWILFFLTFLTPWTSLTFILIWKVVEIKNNA